MEKTDKRTDILQAAEKLFCEFGYEGTSTRQISKESGANMAMINYYFGSKEGVLIEIMESRIAGFKSQLNAIQEEPISPKEKIVKVIEQYTSRIFLNVSFHKLMHRELSLTQRPEIFKKIKDAMAQNLEVIEAIIESGITEGYFRPVDVRMTIVSMMGTISMVATSPNKVVPAQNFDIANKADKAALKDRLVAHLQDLILTHLAIPKK